MTESMSSLPTTGALPRLPLSSRRDVDPYHSLDPSARDALTDADSVVALGGGHGLSASLSALRLLAPALTAVVTVADDGGSSGRLRNDLGVLPPGDLRMALAALCDDSQWGRTWSDVMQHRFSIEGHPDEGLDNHALGNLLIVTLWELLGDPVEGLRWAGALLGARGQVLPMSCTPLVIEGDVAPGSSPTVACPPEAVTRTVTGQARLAKEADVCNVRLCPADAEACPEAVTAIEEAAWVVLGPGSWHTSVLPHLLLPQLRDAICASPAKRLVTLNLSRDSETLSMGSGDQLRVLKRYAPELRLDVVLADPSAAESPKDVEAAAAQLGAVVHWDSLRDKDGGSVHNPFKLAAAYQQIMNAEH